jgi:hypothetical protein
LEPIRVRKVSCDGIYLQSLDLASDLGFAGDESKLNTRDALDLGNRKDCVKGATIPASHVLGTNQWPAQRRKRLNTEPQTSPAIRNWELDDVGLAQSDRYRHCFFGRIRPITTPNTASQWLLRTYLTCPRKRLSARVPSLVALLRERPPVHRDARPYEARFSEKRLCAVMQKIAGLRL